MDHRTSHADIDHRFDYHPPQGEVDVRSHQAVRGSLKALAHGFIDSLPASDERDLAVRHLEYAMFWANAAIARHKP